MTNKEAFINSIAEYGLENCSDDELGDISLCFVAIFESEYKSEKELKESWGLLLDDDILTAGLDPCLKSRLNDLLVQYLTSQATPYPSIVWSIGANKSHLENIPTLYLVLKKSLSLCLEELLWQSLIWLDNLVSYSAEFDTNSSIELQEFRDLFTASDWFKSLSSDNRCVEIYKRILDFK
jgi:hypothetical protein